jgi:hypothetical protein
LVISVQSACSHLWSTPHQKHTLPYVGITQAIRFCHNGNVFLNVDTGLAWFNIESSPPDSGRHAPPIHVLDVQNSTICGVRVDLSRPILDPGKRDEIRKALAKIIFHMRYVKPNDVKGEEGKRVFFTMMGIKFPSNINCSNRYQFGSVQENSC